MATDLNLRLWWDGGDNAARFLEVVDALAGWPLADAKLQGLVLRDRQMRKVGADDRIHTPADLRAAFTGRDVAHLKFSTGLSFPAWRFVGPTATEGHVRLGVDGWGPGWRPERDRRVEGDANLWIQAAGPFVALLGDSEDDRRINAHVEENIERLLDLCQHLIRTVAPTQMMVYTDAGMALPVNAHLAWFSQPVQVLDHLAWLRELWAKGLPAYNLPPLREPATPQDSLSLHGWRSRDQRTRLWEALGACVSAEATLEDVTATLKSGAFDFFVHGEGVLLLDYPHPCNAFLDRFYLAVLERAARRG